VLVDDLAAAAAFSDAYGPEHLEVQTSDPDALLASIHNAGATKHAERVRTALGGQQSAIVLVDDLAAAAAFSNAYGPEHLELQTADPDALLALIQNAGAIFVGPSAPVSLGDYLAGSNHVLPTGGQARFSPGLGAYSFLRPQQVIRYDRDALRTVADRIVALSTAEDLPAHGEAVTIRFARWS
jgi:histidinol dehydrogenase